MRPGLLYAVVAGLAVLGVTGCGSSTVTTEAGDDVSPTRDVSIAVVGLSECKDFPTGIPRASAPPSVDCVEWWHVGGNVLHLRHVNAGFNCCPVIDADIRVEGAAITVEEIEIEGNCDCLCLFDVEYEIHGLASGVYHVVFVEPYRPVDDPVLEFDLDLLSFPSGSHCVERSQYPWVP
jgi:hypothetical protein